MMTLLFVLVLCQPYLQCLHCNAKTAVGLLSQLPAEVDVQSIVKAFVLGTAKTDKSGSMGQCDMRIHDAVSCLQVLQNLMLAWTAMADELLLEAATSMKVIVN
eukprot:GHRR01026614.1.p1 GENE.GHRR01026614.1~~GHRR01026614.1.p1  ORF type:complete len:103 (+),score=20.98 GHRR01026614.1:591-899(+)